MKGQELGISAVLLIVLGIIVLVLVIVFVILPIARFSPSQSNYNLTGFQHTCQVDCGLASQDSPSQTQFCQASAYIDGQTLHCYSQYAPNQYVYDSGQCLYTAKNGSQMTADSSTCV